MMRLEVLALGWCGLAVVAGVSGFWLGCFAQAGVFGKQAKFNEQDVREVQHHAVRAGAAYGYEQASLGVSREVTMWALEESLKEEGAGE